MTRLSTSSLSFGLLCAALSSGCMSDRQAHSLSYGFTQALFGHSMDVPHWTDTFRMEKQRMPKDYAELQRFVAHETNSRLQLEQYPRVDFALLPSGQRQVKFYSVVDGVTNNTSTVAWGKRDKYQ